MNTYILWENDNFAITTPKNPHLPYSEGPHLIVSPKRDEPNAWADVDLAGETFRMAAQACKIMEQLELAPWFNILATGNWGLLPGGRSFFHLHVFGRNKTERWGKPVILPEAAGTYDNEPMPEADRTKLIEAFKAGLNAV